MHVLCTWTGVKFYCGRLISVASLSEHDSPDSSSLSLSPGILQNIPSWGILSGGLQSSQEIHLASVYWGPGDTKVRDIIHVLRDLTIQRERQGRQQASRADGELSSVIDPGLQAERESAQMKSEGSGGTLQGVRLCLFAELLCSWVLIWVPSEAHFHPQFTEEGIEAQQSKLTCPKWQAQSEGEARFECKISEFRVQALNRYTIYANHMHWSVYFST